MCITGNRVVDAGSELSSWRLQKAPAPKLDEMEAPARAGSNLAQVYTGVDLAGQFDTWGSSHQLFHILVVIVKLVHLAGIGDALEYNYRTTWCATGGEWGKVISYRARFG